MSKKNGTLVQADEEGTTVASRSAHHSADLYRIDVTIEGRARMLMHAYNCEAVEAKAAAKKGSVAKKTDDVQSYVRRNDAGEIVIPDGNIKACLADAAKRFQDPSSKMRTMIHTVRAGLFVSPEAAPVLNAKGETTTEWDGLDVRGAQVQRNRVTRTRPFMERGWRLTFSLNVITGDLITEDRLREIVDLAGRCIGLGDFRPDFGRFSVVSWERHDRIDER